MLKAKSKGNICKYRKFCAVRKSILKKLYKTFGGYEFFVYFCTCHNHLFPHGKLWLFISSA